MSKVRPEEINDAQAREIERIIAGFRKLEPAGTIGWHGSVGQSAIASLLMNVWGQIKPEKRLSDFDEFTRIVRENLVRTLS